MNEHTQTLLFPEATELENKRERFRVLANYVLSSTDGEFFVYGTFYPLTDLPLLHSIKTYDSTANIKKKKLHLFLLRSTIPTAMQLVLPE